MVSLDIAQLALATLQGNCELTIGRQAEAKKEIAHKLQ